MPMIDVYATRGTFKDPKSLARELATTLMKIEKVPDIPMFRQNTAGFVHDLPNGTLSNVEGDGNYVRVQGLTNAGALDRDKQLAVVLQFTDLVAAAAGDASLANRTWALLTQALEPGWGLAGQAHTNARLEGTPDSQPLDLPRAKGPAMTDRDVDRLLQDPSIIRNRGKIQATVDNARAMRSSSPSLLALAKSHESTRRLAPRSLGALPKSTPQADAFAKQLKSQGYRFVGPTSVYAFMQNVGVVNDHLHGCFRATDYPQHPVRGSRADRDRQSDA